MLTCTEACLTAWHEPFHYSIIQSYTCDNHPMSTTMPTTCSKHMAPSSLKPDYICIDKACLVLRTCVANSSWRQTWSRTSRFIVDAYHYTNHSADNNLCRTWCNPTPRDGSAPNLVITGRTRDGNTFRKSAFNTQACEQLNAWLGGFESILRKMTPGNFNWFLHTMLTYHTTHVQKRLARANVHISDSSESSEI